MTEFYFWVSYPFNSKIVWLFYQAVMENVIVMVFIFGMVTLNNVLLRWFFIFVCYVLFKCGDAMAVFGA